MNIEEAIDYCAREKEKMKDTFPTNLKDLLRQKRDELVLENGKYNDNLTRLHELRCELDDLKKSRESRMERIRKQYFMTCFAILLFQILVDLDGMQHPLALMSINVNGIILTSRRDRIRQEIKDKEKEIDDLEIETNDLYDIVFDLRDKVHRLTEEVKNIPENVLDEQLINEANQALDSTVLESSYEGPKKLMLTY